MALNNTVQLHAFVKGEFLRMSYQVLLQLFVVGDDTIVDDDKLWERAARVNRLDKRAECKILGLKEHLFVLSWLYPSGFVYIVLRSEHH